MCKKNLTIKTMTKVIDLQDRIIKKLYMEDLLLLLDLYATKKHIEEIENYEITITQNELRSLLEEYGMELIKRMAKIKEMIEKENFIANADPEDILNEIFGSEDNLYIDDEFMVHEFTKEEIEAMKDERD